MQALQHTCLSEYPGNILRKVCSKIIYPSDSWMITVHYLPGDRLSGYIFIEAVNRALLDRSMVSGDLFVDYNQA